MTGQGAEGPGMTGEFRWDDFRLDVVAYRLERAGRPVALEPKALDALSLLVSRPGRLVTKQEIFDAVWPGTAVTDHALTRVIAQLRRVLGDDSRKARYIETVPTRGYRWIGRVEVDTPASSAPAAAAVVSPLPAQAMEPAPPVWPRRRFVVLSSAGVVLVAAAAIWATGVGSSSQPSARTLTKDPTPAGVAWPVQVTTHGGLDLTPALSPRGDAIAFASDRSGAFEIYVRPFADAATDVALTSDGAHNVQPAWSPDGRFVAYHSAARGGIWVVPAHGGVPRQVVREGSRPAWSPDGEQIAYQSDEHADVTPSAYAAQAGSTLWVVATDGGGAHAITHPGQPMGGHASPAWSPDGRFVGFTVFEGGPDDGAWLLTMASGATTRLEAGRHLYELAFAPDGSVIYAAGGDALIYRMPFDAAHGVLAGPVEPIAVAGVPGVRGLSVAPDGRRLAFAGLGLNSQIWAQPLGPDGTPAGGPRALTDDTSRRNSMAVVSPDGARVAYRSTRRGEPPNVWVMNIDGTAKVQLTSDHSAEGQPTWYPDGRRVAYFSNRDGTIGFWSVDIEARREELVLDVARHGRDLTALGHLREIELSPSLTRMAISLVTPRDSRRRIYVTPLDRLAPRFVGEDVVSAGYPAWSPDERRLAVEIKDGSSTQAAIIDVETGALTRLTDEPGQTWVRSWSPDGSRIVVAALRDGRWSLQWIEVAGGRRGAVLPPGPPNVYVRYPEWSPRNDVIVFERGELGGNIWTLPIR